MPDIPALIAVASNLKSAFEIGRGIMASEGTLERAELKLRLAEVITAVAEARIELAAVLESVQERDKRIAELETAFEERATLVRWEDAYYRAGPTGAAYGPSYCAKCWDESHKLRQLTHDQKNWSYACHVCGSTYDRNRASPLDPRAS